MHEFALAEDIVNIISKKVSKNLKKISAINIDVGSFSGIIIDSLDFGLRIIMEENNNTQVKINIQQVPTIATCECGKEYEIKEIFDSCPGCGSLIRKISTGKDIIINSIELEDG